MSGLRPSSKPDTDQDLPSLGSRRPSWISSLSEHENSHIIKSRSKRRRKQYDEGRPHTRSLGTHDGTIERARKPKVETEASSEQFKKASSGAPLLESPDEGKRFRSSWEINVKDLVGDAVGNVRSVSCECFFIDTVSQMSISPTSRDIVLAAYVDLPVLHFQHSLISYSRRGLFIIDLESPFSVPRFLPQGGTWDVADVQWNPHQSHVQYIVSTSSEKVQVALIDR